MTRKSIYFTVVTYLNKHIVSILAAASLLLLILYTIDWEFDDNLPNFLSFVIGIILLLLIFFWSVIQILFYKNYQTIVILLLLSLFFVLPLKRYYVLMDFSLNKEKRDKVVRLYKAKKLSQTNQKLYDGIKIYDLPEKYSGTSNDRNNVIYGYEQCVLFPLFHHRQMLLYCKKPQDFLKKYHYGVVYEIDDGHYWIAEKTSSEI